MIDLLAPYCCPACGRVIDKEAVICRECLSKLERTEQSFCRGNNTEELFSRFAKFIRGAAFLWVFPHSTELELIHAMKYGPFANPNIAYCLGKELAAEFMQTDFFDGIDYLIPVPLHPRRLRERGFNQSEWLCRGISEITHIPTDTTHLLRVRNNEHQARLAGADRKKNIKGVFAVRFPEDLYKKHILLVDDLITTGATINACMKALHPIRGCRISVLGLGKAN